MSARLTLVIAWLTLALAPAFAEGAAKGAVSGGSGDRLGGLLGGFRLGGEGGPVNIEAATMEFDYETRVIIYRGSVTVHQADLTLRSDSLRITLDPERAERPREIVAEGHVRIEQGARRASGGRAVFDDAAHTVTLSEAARLQDGPNEVAGDRVVVYLDEQRSVVEGGSERVRAVLYPSSMKAEMGETPGIGATPKADGR